MSTAWTQFYEAIATKLLDFKNKRNELVEKIEDLHETVNWNNPQIATLMINNMDLFTLITRVHKEKETEYNKNIEEVKA